MEQLEKIIRYLDGEVIGEDKKSFENELTSDSSLRDAFELVKKIDSTLADEQLLKFVSNIQKVKTLYSIQEVDDLTKSPENKELKMKSISIKRYLSVAAVMLVLAVSSILYYNFSTPKNERIYNQYYTKYESSVITRSGTTEVNALISAIQLYDQGNYTGALDRLNFILKTDKTNTSAHFFSGLSYMELKSYEKAIYSFSNVIMQHDTAFLEHAEWYIALCYLKTDHVIKASDILSHIAISESFYKIRAVDLLKRLK